MDNLRGMQEKTQQSLSEQEVQEESKSNVQYHENEEKLEPVSVPYDKAVYESSAYHDNGNDEERGLAPETITYVDDNDVHSQPTISRSGSGSQIEASTAAAPSVLARTLTLVRTRSTGRSVAPPPDGGFVAWSQVLFGHFVMVNTWGYTNAFGVFQTYYTENLGESPSTISWIGSTQTFLIFFIGTLSGRATDAGYFKFTWACGMFITVLSLFLTSLCTEYWQIFLSQGIMQGLGSGLMFCPTLSLLPTYFEKRRAVAIAAVASGSSTGGLILPAMVTSLLTEIGYAWTMRALGFFTLGTLLPGLFFLRQRLPPRSSGPLVEVTAFREIPYLCFAIGMFFVLWGLYVGFFYVSSYDVDILGASTTSSTNLLMVMSGVGLPGRVIPGLVSDAWTGPLNLLTCLAIGTAVTAYGWYGVHSVSSLYGWAVVYGICSAGVQGLFPVTLSSLTDDLKKIGVRMGMVMTIVSFAALTGTPIAGALVQADKNGSSYLYMQMFMGSVMLLGTMLLVFARVNRFGFALVKG